MRFFFQDQDCSFCPGAFKGQICPSDFDFQNFFLQKHWSVFFLLTIHLVHLLIMLSFFIQTICLQEVQYCFRHEVCQVSQGLYWVLCLIYRCLYLPCTKRQFVSQGGSLLNFPSKNTLGFYSESEFHFMALSVILSVHGADTTAEVKLLIYPCCADLLIYEINYWVSKQLEFACNNFYIIYN